jgi:phosphomannomutase
MPAHRTDAVFKAYDIRGTVPDQLDAELCRAVGGAFARFASLDKVLVARDMRQSGEALSAAFAEGARREGVEVTDIGMASTDMVYFASGRYQAAGAMFTASHNPAAYNGIKLCLPGARPVGTDTGLAQIQALTEELLAHPSSGPLRGALRHDDRVLDAYADHVRSFIDTAGLRPLKVVTDTANGMGGLVVPKVMGPLPVELTMLYPELDGSFPNHPADPIQPANLVDLNNEVLAKQADIGLAFDGDADRVFLVDEQAQPVSGSLTTAFVAAAMLDKHPGATILYNLICSHVVPEVIEERGGVAVRTRVGHSFIKQTMAETKAVFGGEHSGHYYFADNYRADSGIIAAMVVLGVLGRSDQPLSALLAPYRRYADSGEINTEVPEPKATVEAVAERVAATGATIDRLDGLTVEYPDWWYNIRPSNTEPLLRLNLEASDDASCRAHTDEVLALVREAAGV